MQTSERQSSELAEAQRHVAALEAEAEGAAREGGAQLDDAKVSRVPRVEGGGCLQGEGCG